MHGTAHVLDGNTSDDRFNSTSPGGNGYLWPRREHRKTRAFYCKYCWLDYKFEARRCACASALTCGRRTRPDYIGDNDPRFALFGEFGDYGRDGGSGGRSSESQRLGLTNDNDLMYYTFSVGYNLKPHRFQFDVTYFRDRFNGADTQARGRRVRGQKTDTVLVRPVGVAGPGRCGLLVQGSAMVGTAQGQCGRDCPGRADGGPGADRNCDVVADSAVAYAEADLGIVRPFVMALWATGDGDPTDHQLQLGSIRIRIAPPRRCRGRRGFAHLDTSQCLLRAGLRLSGARRKGLGMASVNAPGGATSATTPGAPGIPGRSGPVAATGQPHASGGGTTNP